MTEPPKRYRAFISYSQKDKGYAKRLHRALETYRLPRDISIDANKRKSRTLGRIFRDDDEMGASTDLGAALRGAIDDSESLIVMCSPNAAKSEWVNKEIIHFKRSGRSDRIFAVISDGEPSPPAERSDRECFPPALRYVVSPDGEVTDEPAEPLALDRRKEPHNRIIVRLVSGLLSTPFDALWKRAQRRARTRAAITSVALLFIATMLGLAVTQDLWRPRFDEWLLVRLHYGENVKSGAELAELDAGESFQDCAPAGSAYCPEMVIVPSGEYVMGNPQNSPDSDGDEHPQRTISVRRFAVSRYEITFDDWEACVTGGGCLSQQSPADSAWGRADRPVIHVSWNEAQEYVAWLSGITGENYRLLTEAEWEYAARAGTHTRYSWGDDAPVCDGGMANRAVFIGCSDPKTRPVGFSAPNGFGLFDMHGNVWEWVEDCHRPSYDPMKSDAGAVSTDGAGNAPTECTNRVYRGGAWNYSARWLRSAKRNRVGPTDRQNHIGFRVARSL